MVSIKDVARHAGVAISTVSKVLNSYPNVSDETRGRVTRAVAELNFVPNSVAAALSSKQSARVALLVNLNTKTQAIDEISLQYIQGAINKAMELNLDVITLFFSMFQDKTVEELIRYLKSQSIGGIIIYGISMNDAVLRELAGGNDFKCVVVDAPLTSENTSCVRIDHAKAQYEVAKRTIVDNNCHRVLYISGRENSYVAREQQEGMARLAREMDLEMLLKYGELSELKARNITMEYGECYDTVICGSDLMAIGAMKALTEMDIFRPVCGYDGIILMGYVGKQMNTVRQNFAGISATAMEELHRLMNGKKGEDVRTPYTLERMKYTDIIC